MKYILILIAYSSSADYRAGVSITQIPTEYVNKEKCQQAGIQFKPTIGHEYFCIPSGNNP
jgi:hypothetical protein